MKRDTLSARARQMALILGLATQVAFGVDADRQQVVATVNGTPIHIEEIAVPTKRMVALFEKRLGRRPGEKEQTELEQLRMKYERWVLCVKIREIAVVKKTLENLKTDDCLDPHKGQAFEESILRDAALKDPEVAAYLQVRQQKRDPVLEKRVFAEWERNQLAQADIRILHEDYRACLQWLTDSLYAPSADEMVEEFFRRKTQGEGQRSK